jgi:hypothetical protein
LDASRAPFGWYKALVVAGALQHGLPDEYVRTLEGVVATRDPDSARREAARAVLGDFGRLTKTKRPRTQRRPGP